MLTIRIKPKNKQNRNNKIIGVIDYKKTPQSKKFIKILGSQNQKQIISLDIINLTKDLINDVKVSYATAKIITDL
jgi:hypothetical protein